MASPIDCRRGLFRRPSRWFGALGISAWVVLPRYQYWLFTNSRPDVLVVGGTGLMGAPAARLLQQQGHHVVVLSRKSARGLGTGGRRPEQSQAEVVVCDREDDAAFREILVDPTMPSVVVDFAAMKEKHIETVLAAHRIRPLAHYVFISTNMVYPGGPEDMDISDLGQPVNEDDADLSAAEATPDTYGGRKLRCEALLARAAQDDQFPWTTVRPSAVVGPGCDSRHERLQRAVSGLPPLSPPRRKRGLAKRPGRFKVTYAGDVAAVIASIVMRGAAVHGEVFNVASMEAMTMTEYVASMSRLIGRDPLQAPVDVALRNFEKQGAIDTTKAERSLDFEPTPFDQWMKETLVWHQPCLS